MPGDGNSTSERFIEAIRQLGQAQYDYERAREEVDRLQEGRRRALRDAAAIGLSRGQIADILGISAGRVAQIMAAPVESGPVRVGRARPKRTLSKSANAEQEQRADRDGPPFVRTRK